MDINCPVIMDVTNQIVAQIPVQKIILFNRKLSFSGNTSSFKLCIVTDTTDRQKLLQNIYVEVDCEVPFDIVLYTTKQWQQAAAQSDSFAHGLIKMGCVLYEQSPIS